ncbi:hypothetical protein V8F20_005313 [Naviculisporaceae sp. PSN 640]
MSVIYISMFLSWLALSPSDALESDASASDTYRVPHRRAYKRADVHLFSEILSHGNDMTGMNQVSRCCCRSFFPISPWQSWH